MDSMRIVLARTPGMRSCATACATPRSPLRQGSYVFGGSPGRQRRILPIGGACCWSQRALSVSGGTPTRGGALGHHGTSPALALSDALPVTPRVATCTGPLVDDP